MNDGELVKISDIKTAEERAYRAYQMRLGGTSHQEIAEALGYKGARSVIAAIQNIVEKAMREVSVDRKSEVIELELDRLDALQNAVWGIAMTGDYKAIDTALKIMSHRAKLLSLGEDSGNKSTNTVIVASEGYAETLRNIT